MKRWAFCLLFLFLQQLNAADQVIEINFHDLMRQENFPTLHGKRVRLTGFLYKKEDQWVLAAVPNLKTCCVAHVNKKKEQLLVSGEIKDTLPGHAVTLEGYFRHQDGSCHLHQATQIEKESSPHRLLVGAIPLTAFFLYFLRRRKSA